jgi:hypothetical protein
MYIYREHYPSSTAIETQEDDEESHSLLHYNYNECKNGFENNNKCDNILNNNNHNFYSPSKNGVKNEYNHSGR